MPAANANDPFRYAKLQALKLESLACQTLRGLFGLGQDREWCAIPRDFFPAPPAHPHCDLHEAMPCLV